MDPSKKTRDSSSCSFSKGNPTELWRIVPELKGRYNTYTTRSHLGLRISDHVFEEQRYFHAGVGLVWAASCLRVLAHLFASFSSCGWLQFW